MRLIFKDFINLNLSEHKKILSLRNSDEIRKQMKTSENIEFSNHKKWLKTLDKEHKYYAIFYDEMIIGSINYFPIKNKIYEWGFYFDEKTNPLIKSLCVYIIIEKLFSIGAEKIISEVKKSNQNAYNFNKSFGFLEIKEENGYKTLSLCKDKWQNFFARKKLAKKATLYEFKS